MDGDDHRIDAPAPRDVERFAQRVGVQGIEAAVSRRIDARALGGRKNGAYGHHAASW